MIAINRFFDDNKDQFSADDLKILLGITQSAGAAMPAADVTVDTIKKAIAAKGSTGTGDKADGGKADSGKSDAGTGGLSASAKAKISGASPTQQTIFNALFGSTGKGPTITDDDVNRFFAIVPPDLRDGDAAKLVAQTQRYQGGSVADLLSGLTTAVAALRMPQTGANVPDGVADDTSGAVAAPPDTQGSTEDLVAALASIVRRSDYSKIGESILYFQAKKEEAKIGATMTKTLVTVQNGKRLAAVVSLKVTDAGGDWMQVEIVGSSVLVDADQKQIANADALKSTRRFRITWSEVKK